MKNKNILKLFSGRRSSVLKGVKSTLLLLALAIPLLMSAPWGDNTQQVRANGDLDLDGILDIVDNCPEVYNPKQYDFNNNEIGDVCEEIELYKEEDILFVLGPDPFDQQAPRETIILSGSAWFDDQGSEGTDVHGDLNMELSGFSNLLGGELLLEGWGGYNYQEKFEGLGFPADAQMDKEFQIILDSEPLHYEGPLYLAYGNDEPSQFFNKLEEGIIKRFPPLWGDPLCWQPDPESQEETRQPIAVWMYDDEDWTQLGWIILNCDEFWWEAYYEDELPPHPEDRHLPEEFSYEDLDSEMELKIDLGDGPETIVLRGPTSISGSSGQGRTIETEILSMDLSGEDIRLTAGSGNNGTITPLFDTPDSPDFPADSFFDVFFEIEVGEEDPLYPFTFDLHEQQWTPGVELSAYIKEIPWYSAYCYQADEHGEEECLPDGAECIITEDCCNENCESGYCGGEPLPQEELLLPIRLYDTQDPDFQQEPDGVIERICYEFVPSQVLPGQDLFETSSGSSLDFDTPIPADFFGPGSDPFGGQVNLQGQPLGRETGAADTIVERLEPADVSEPLPNSDIVYIEIVALNLRSTEPITVTFNGGQNPELWDVQVDLSELPQPQGEMTITKTHENGGTFTSEFHIQPRFTFTRVDDPQNVQVLDTGLESLPPLELNSIGDPPWVHERPPGVLEIPGQSNFFPGVDVDGNIVPITMSGSEIIIEIVEEEEEPEEELLEVGDAAAHYNHDGADMDAYPSIVANFPVVVDPSVVGPNGNGLCHEQGPAYLATRSSNTKTYETDADLTPDQDLITNIDPSAGISDRDEQPYGGDDGLILPSSFKNGGNQQIIINGFDNNTGMFVNAWFDWNRDGDWSDQGEWAVVNLLTPGAGLFGLNPSVQAPVPNDQPIWIRVALSEVDLDDAGQTDQYHMVGGQETGCFEDGETEDYYISYELSCGPHDIAAEFNSNDDSWDRGNCGPDTEDHYYDVYTIDLVGPGPHNLNIETHDTGQTGDTYLYAYQSSGGGPDPFDKSQPCSNEIGSDDDGGNGLLSKLELTGLDEGIIQVVATTYSGNYGTFPYRITMSTNTCDSGDRDDDGIPNEADNCPDTSNLEILSVYDFADEADENSTNDKAYRSSQEASPPEDGPELEDREFYDEEICEGNGPDTFHISTKTESGWVERYAQGFPYNYDTVKFDLSSYLPDADGEYKVKVTHEASFSAQIDMLTLGGNAPSQAIIEGEGLSIVDKVSTRDNDVASVGNKSVIASFESVNKEGPMLTLTAREETEASRDANKPIVLPGAGEQYFQYQLTQNKAILVDGKIDASDNLGEPDIELFTVPSSGHPSGYVYGYTGNDAENLYLSLDITSDNTNDPEGDYTTLIVGDKSFKVSNALEEYGQTGFVYTDKVSYQHKITEFKIPLSEINALVGESIEFKVEIYGTQAVADEYYCQIAASDGPDSSWPDYRYWAQTDDSYIDNYNTQRFEFLITNNPNDIDSIRVHWEGLSADAVTTASFYVWNTTLNLSGGWQLLDTHPNNYDTILEQTISPASNYIVEIDGDDKVVLLVQGDIEEDNGNFSETILTDYVKIETLKLLPQTDSDGDGVGDLCDNCPEIPNPGQENRDSEFFYYDDFEDGDEDFLEQSGKWKVKNNGVYRQDSNKAGDLDANLSGFSFLDLDGLGLELPENFSFETVFRMGGNDVGDVNFRTQSVGNMYAVKFDKTGEFSLVKVVGGVETELDTYTHDDELPGGGNNLLLVVVQGNRIEVYYTDLDDDPGKKKFIMKATDSTFSGGTVGFSTHEARNGGKGSKVDFHYIDIRSFRYFNEFGDGSYDPNDDFDFSGGNWFIKDGPGVLQQKDKNDDYYAFWKPNGEMPESYIFETNIRLGGKDTADTSVRMIDTEHMYSVRLSKDNNSISFVKVTPAGEEVLAGISRSISGGPNNRLRVIVNGDRYTVIHNGDKIIEVTDSTYSTGTVGFSTYESKVDFHYMLLVEIDNVGDACEGEIAGGRRGTEPPPPPTLFGAAPGELPDNFGDILRRTLGSIEVCNELISYLVETFTLGLRDITQAEAILAMLDIVTPEESNELVRKGYVKPESWFGSYYQSYVNNLLDDTVVNTRIKSRLLNNFRQDEEDLWDIPATFEIVSSVFFPGVEDPYESARAAGAIATGEGRNDIMSYPRVIQFFIDAALVSPYEYDSQDVIDTLFGSDLLLRGDWLSVGPAYFAEVMALVDKHLPCLNELTKRIDLTLFGAAPLPPEALTIDSGTEHFFDFFAAFEPDLSSRKYDLNRQSFRDRMHAFYDGSTLITTEIIEKMMETLSSGIYGYNLPSVPVLPSGIQSQVNCDELGDSLALSPLMRTPATGTTLTCSMKLPTEGDNFPLSDVSIVLPPNSFIFNGALPDISIIGAADGAGFFLDAVYSDNPSQTILIGEDGEQRVGLVSVPESRQHRYLLNDALTGIQITDNAGTPLATISSPANYGIIDVALALRNLFTPVADQASPVTIKGYAAAYR